MTFGGYMPDKSHLIIIAFDELERKPNFFA